MPILARDLITATLPSMSYRRTQIGWLTGGIPLVFFTTAGLMLTVSGHLALGLGVMASGGLVLALFGWLTVTVASDSVRVAFGIGYRRSIPVSDIRSAKTARSPWWAGWGIRFVPRGFLYNVAGRQVVDLELSGGGRVMIGTDDPGGLARAINDRIAELPT